ncbi:hypothetical protein E4U57_000597 [Claviceps arundinis]|uniref:Uncharacterized protein n=1 Tax=Claviceps arundinis TaxID=1623583 RepID=A0ABQ7PCX6_9HYPO|nr:hypothetical protein E4U57_000597 [Claviceps arundinis]
MPETLSTRKAMPSSPLAASPNEAKYRSNGDAGGPDLSQASPTASKSTPLYNFQTPNTPNVASPYLSESAHVLSLQNPVSDVEHLHSGKSGAVTPKSEKGAIKTGKYTNSIQRGIGALPTVQPNSRSVHTRTTSKEFGLKDLSSKETGARYLGKDIGSNETSFQYVCEDIGSKETGSKCIVSTDVISRDHDPKDKNFKETGANYIAYQDAAPKNSVLFTVNESFLIPPGIGSQIHSEHGK